MAQCGLGWEYTSGAILDTHDSQDDILPFFILKMTPVVGFPQVIAARPSCLDRIVFANMSCEKVNEPPPGKRRYVWWGNDPPSKRLKTILREEHERVSQAWEERFKAEQDAREKAAAAWERTIEAKVAWEEARRAHEVARDTLRRAESLADIARDQSCIIWESEQAAWRRTKEEIRELEGPPVIPDDDSDSSRVTLSLEQFGYSQTPFADS